jgi:hypothetical protein
LYLGLRLSKLFNFTFYTSGILNYFILHRVQSVKRRGTAWRCASKG